MYEKTKICTKEVVSKEGIDKILEVLPENGWVIFGEVYAEFADIDTLRGVVYIKEKKNVVKVRTFSKY